MPPPQLAGAATAGPSGSSAAACRQSWHPWRPFFFPLLPPPRSRLADVVKLPLLEREETARVAAVWREHHAGRLDAVAEVWSPVRGYLGAGLWSRAEQRMAHTAAFSLRKLCRRCYALCLHSPYARISLPCAPLSLAAQAEFAGIAERKRRCPRFLYPVRKGAGAFFTLYAEWQDNFCIFTFLDDYRRNPATAQPWFSVALYDDLLARKQVRRANAPALCLPLRARARVPTASRPPFRAACTHPSARSSCSCAATFRGTCARRTRRTC